MLLVDAVSDHPQTDDTFNMVMLANRHAQIMNVKHADRVHPSACTNSPTKKEFHTLVPCTGHACMHIMMVDSAACQHNTTAT